MAATSRLFLLTLIFLVTPVAQSQAAAEENAVEDTAMTAENEPGGGAKPAKTPAAMPATDGAAPSEEESAAATDSQATDTETTPDTSVEVNRDVVLVLDNSGSMRKNDPQSLATAAVEQFIQQLGPGNRVAILIFDQDVTLAQEFINVQSGRDQLLSSLDAVDYSGQYTDSPAAIERAIYILKNNARDEARRIIIFMTDGIVDTGNPQNDISRTDWLRNDLAADAGRAGIQIFGIAFTNAADFQLIQSLANKTEGDYFRALTADDLHGVFERINEVIVREAQPEPEPEPEPAAAPPQPQQQVIQAPAPEPIIIEVPSKSQDTSGEERTRNLILIVAASVLCLTVLAILIVLIKRSRSEREPGEEYEPKAYLSDIHGVTEKQSYQLSRKPTMIGRVAGTDEDHLNYIVIPETTVGRRHALIEYKDYAYWIIDQGSINGTYVNDHMVNTETRLKHGDRIRLHKFEFEFVMPEMFDSGMTVVSNTAYARDIASDDENAAAAAASADDSGNFENLFSIDGNDDSSPSGGRITLSEENYSGDEDATIQYGESAGNDRPGPAEPTQDPGEDDDDEDATLTPGMDAAAEDDEDATLRRVSPGTENDGDDSDEWDIDQDDRDDK